MQSQEPFVKLDKDGKASILNYNLPQSTCYDATSFIGLNIHYKLFKVNQRRKPGKSYWDITVKSPLENIIEQLRSGGLAIGNVPYMYDPDPMAHRVPRDYRVGTEVMGDINLPRTMMATFDTASESYYENIAHQIKAGYFPVRQLLFSGLSQILYLNEPSRAKPQITMVMHLKMCSFLGDYGAGRTVKTFSLLPGERTNISIRTYEHREESRTVAQNVMDSYSAESAQDLQSSIEHEMNMQAEKRLKRPKAKQAIGKLEEVQVLILALFLLAAMEEEVVVLLIRIL
ncbi:MAG: hypothetical protein JKY48_15935 [Flavobacteriales bacterium]|nr:hypothetical protein [Flavobacteriales bacterium]